MNIRDTCATLDQQLGAEIAQNPLDALSAIEHVRQIIGTQQRRAVRAAVLDHSWAEIGAAMGVTKQAAHHKFARVWINELKAELKAANATVKSATRDGDPKLATAAEAKRDQLIAEIKRASRKRK